MKQNINNTPIPDNIDVLAELHRALKTFRKDLDTFHITDRISGQRNNTLSAHHIYRLVRKRNDGRYYGFAAGKCVGSISASRYNILHTKFFTTRQRNPSLHDTLQSCTFQEEVAELLHRHAKHRHRTPTTRLQGVLHTHLGASYIVSTNPIYAHPDVQTFSDYARDALFGSHLQPFTRKWTGCLAVFPQPTPLHIDRAINHAITATICKRPAAVILVTPQFTSTTQITTLYKHHHCHRLATPLDKGLRVPHVILVCNNAYLRQHPPLRADVEYVAHACASTWNCAYKTHVPTRRRPWHGLFPHRTGTRPMPLVGMGPAPPPPNTEPHVSVDLAYVLQKLQCPANDEIVGVDNTCKSHVSIKTRALPRRFTPSRT